MLLSGILTLVLVYWVGKRSFNPGYGLLAMFLLAISPWHIVLSRWGLESNILPTTFLLGYAALLGSRSTNRWFIVSCLFFALSLYAYGTAYAAVPAFLVVMIPALLSFGRVTRKDLCLGIAVFTLVALPIGLLILVNSLHLDSIHLGPVTIPRYPARPRYEAMSALFGGQPMVSVVHNLSTLWSLLVSQNDGLPWNGLAPYGYFYAYTFPLAIVGCAQILFRQGAERRLEQGMVMAWLAAALMIGALQEVNLTRINLVFIPLVLCMALPFEWLWRHVKAACLLAMLALLVGFCLFTRDYHGVDYRQQADRVFFTNLLPALDLARQRSDQQVCVTDRVEMPYIYVLFSERYDPGFFLESIRYRDPDAEFREVVSLGRYAFGVDNCPDGPSTLYVLLDEQPPDDGQRFQVSDFGNFHVYLPR
jgi:hypothetical protein